MSYRYVYPNGATAVAPANGYGIDPAMMSAGYNNGAMANMYNDRRRRSYSPESFSSDSGSSDDYEYRGRLVTRETRRPRDVVRAPTPPPIIKRVVERAPTPEAPVMERVIIRPQAQEIVERVIEQPRTPPPRIIQKEMQEEAPPPIVRTRVIKVDRPLRSGYSQPGSPYGNPCNGLPSFSNGMHGNGGGYRAQSIVGSVGRPAAFQSVMNNNPSYSSASSFEYMPAGLPPPPHMMMMPPAQQQQQPMGIMQPQQSVQQQMMYRSMPMSAPMQQMPQAIPPLPSSYMPHNYMYPQHNVYHPQQGMSFGYRPLMQPGTMMPSGMPMMAGGSNMGTPMSNFPSQPPMFNPMAQQLVY